ncbi:hypothetical protein B0H63DRAFT_517098 [Podospora didyma]|uniref:Ankyrin repeat protein n=1 Tax=Podospora didyma TaxID=330526 RepID=A0AAE0P615_9PEZI|nr:hypothetical protein B0H63DRAFT_517098 [Podospora didyma]
MTRASANAIVSAHHEDIVVTLINALARNQGARPDVRYGAHLFSCLAAHPQSAKLVKLLTKLGCETEAKRIHHHYDDEEVGEEPATVLSWALSQPEGSRIGSLAIEALIDAQGEKGIFQALHLLIQSEYGCNDLSANVKFVAESSRTIPLILAAKGSRSNAVAKLIQAGADVLAQDTFDRSALFYAARMGDLDSVNALKTKSLVDDGSFHEAAKNLYSEVVAALIKAKHAVDFPSSKEQHQDRTALQEMALRCDASSYAAKMETKMLALMKGKPNVLIKTWGKNALFLELEQPPDAVGIQQAIADAKRKRREYEEKQAKKAQENELDLLLKRQTAEQMAEISRAEHEEKKFQADEVAKQKREHSHLKHKQELLQQAEKQTQSDGLLARTSRLKIEIQQETYASKQRSLKDRADFEFAKNKRQQEFDARVLKERQSLQLKYTEMVNAQKTGQFRRQQRLNDTASKRKLIEAKKMAEVRPEALNADMWKLQGQMEVSKMKILEKQLGDQPKNVRRITGA